jgi:hypothetical protein
MYLEEPEIVTLNKIKVTTSSSMNLGGFLYAIGTVSSSTASITIDNTPFDSTISPL